MPAVILPRFRCRPQNEIPLYGASSAAASIPANLIQGVSGLVIAFVLYPILLAVPDIRELTQKANA